jgi:hypothetical protein
MIASEQALLQLAEMRPSNRARLARVQGFTEAKLAKYGEAFLGVVRDFCSGRGVQMDDFPEDDVMFAACAEAAADERMARAGLPVTVMETYR